MEGAYLGRPTPPPKEHLHAVVPRPAHPHPPRVHRRLVATTQPATASSAAPPTRASTPTSGSSCSTCPTPSTPASTTPVAGSTAPAPSSTPTRSSPPGTAPTPSGTEGDAPAEPAVRRHRRVVLRRGGARLLDPSGQLDLRPGPQRRPLRRRGRRRSTPARRGTRRSRPSPTPSTSTRLPAARRRASLELSEPDRACASTARCPRSTTSTPTTPRRPSRRGSSSRWATASRTAARRPRFGGDTRRKADRRLTSFKGAYGYKDISVEFSHAGRDTTGGTCFGDSGGPTFDISTPALTEQNLIVAVTSFGLNSNCNASGSYRLDQPDDIAFLADPAGARS